MAARSTRQKIRDSAQKAINSCEDIAYHLYFLTTLYNDDYPYVDENLNSIMNMQHEFQKVLTRFRDGL